MRIRALHLLAYGHFTGRTLEFPAGAGDLHVVCGPNEAGKSTALRGLRDALFGIPVNTPDNFLHNYRDLRIGAELESSGASVSFTRRKGNKQTLYCGKDAAPLPEDVAGRLLGGLDAALFCSMFGIDHRVLVEGGEELLKGKGDLAQALFAAGAGVAAANACAETFRERCSELLKHHGQGRINTLLKKLRDTRKALNEATLGLQTWAELQRDLREAEQGLQFFESRREQLLREQIHLDQVRLALPLIAGVRSLDEQLAEMVNVPLLRIGAEAELMQQTERLRGAKETISDALQELLLVQNRIASIQLPEPLLAAGEEIAEAWKDSSAVQEAAQELRTALADAHRVENSITGLLQSLPACIAPDQAAPALPDVGVTAQVESLIETFDGIRRELQNGERRCADLRLQQEEAIAVLQSAPADHALQALDAALRLWRERGAAEEKIAAEEALIAGAEAALASLAGTLGLSGRTGESLLAIPLPSAATLDSFRDQIDTANRAVADARRKGIDSRARLAELQRETASLEASGRVPDPAELGETRGVRDEGWRQLRGAWESGLPASASLCGRYEETVLRADEAADRLYAAAEAANTLAALRAQTAQEEDRIRLLEADLLQAGADRDRVLREWEGLWEPSGVKPGTPTCMAVWTRRCEELKTQAAGLLTRRAELARMIGANSEVRIVLAEALEAAGEGAAQEAESCAALAARAEELHARLKDRRAAAHHAQQTLHSLRQQEERAEIERQQAEVALTNWRHEWRRAVAAFGLDGSEGVAAARAVLRQRAELEKEMGRLRDLSAKIRTLSRRVDEFGDVVEELVSRAAPELAHLPPVLAIEEMNKRLTEARRAESRLQSLRSQKKDIGRRLEEGQQTLNRCETAIAALCSECGAADGSSLSHLLQASTRRRELERQREELRKQIRAAAAGRPLETFLAEAGKTDDAAAAARLDAIAREQSETDQHRRAEQDRLLGLKQRGAQMNGSAEGALLAQEIANIEEELSANVLEYMRCFTAEFVMRKAVADYCTRNKRAVVDRASDLFRTLTIGSFSGLEVDYASDPPVLVGVRENCRIAVDGMSDGTRDQLYLALRIASVERYAEEQEPMPFIIDDVLVNFDDHRTQAALGVFAELARKTQVIYFTHHKSVAQMAARFAEDGEASVIRLPGRVQQSQLEEAAV